jgi:hypothetical protein
MSKKARLRPDPIERNIERCLNPGRFVSDGACFSFVRELETVERKIQAIGGTAPHRAVAAYEAFLAGCYAKANEVDDSSGSFGMFVNSLFCGWIKARQFSGSNPDETATRLVAWMEDDPFSFCYDLERDAVKVLDKAGMAAFQRQAQARFDAANTETKGSLPGVYGYPQRHWGAVLRAVYLHQGNVEAYEQITRQTALTPEDCHAMASMLMKRRKNADALAWTERGLPHGEQSSADSNLLRLKRELLVKLGRTNEAFDLMWNEFGKHPHKFSYADLMRMAPKADKAVWHAKAIKMAANANLDSFIEILLETSEIDLLIERLRHAQDAELEDLSHFVTEPMAKRLAGKHTDVAARLWRAQGMRILNAKKSKYYDAALLNFREAKRCYSKAGLDAEWEKVVNEVRSLHYRKAGFVQGFEELVAGSAPRVHTRSFLERAKARWNPQPAEGERRKRTD